MGDGSNPGWAIPAERAEAAFADYKPAYSAGQAVAEAWRCLYCSDAPCTQACPTHIDVPQFIRKIAAGNDEGAARSILAANVLGTSCARVCPVETLCVGACVYNQLGHPPIQIGRLQRYATDRALDAGWRFDHAGPDSGRSVALIGAGPASLACAHELRKAGHRCVVFEKRDVVGGLNTTGVAPYKMRADTALREAAWVLGIGGCEVRTGVEVGREVSLADLEREFDAVFFGAGLGADTRLGVAGEDLPGVYGAVAFIEALKLGVVDLAGVRHALVVGGGNTAIDGVRELLTLGVPSVSLVYRGVQAGMPGYAHEWSAAQVKGAKAEWHAAPVAFEGEGRVQRAVLGRMDASKRPTGDTYTIAADLVLVAIGQGKLGALLAGLPGVRIDKGVVVADADGFTGRPKWYVGGDARNGGKEVVNAAAEGKAAALAICRALA